MAGNNKFSLLATQVTSIVFSFRRDRQLSRRSTSSRRISPRFRSLATVSMSILFEESCQPRRALYSNEAWVTPLMLPPPPLHIDASSSKLSANPAGISLHPPQTVPLALTLYRGHNQKETLRAVNGLIERERLWFGWRGHRSSFSTGVMRN